MNNFEFMDLFLHAMNDYWLSLFIAITVYFFLYRKFYTSLLDPFSFAVLGSCLGFSIVLFLFITNEISPYYFINYLLTQFAYMFTFRLVAGKTRVLEFPETVMKTSSDYVKCIFFVSTIMFIFSQLYVYKQVGIPLFKRSHLETFTTGEVSGLFGRFIGVSKFFSLYIATDIQFRRKKYSKLYIYVSYTVFLFFIISSIFSGSKGAFMFVGLVFFAYAVLNPSITVKKMSIYSFVKKSEKKIILIGILVVVFVLFANARGEKSLLDSWASFGFRLLAYGDVYWFSYPTGYIELLDNGKFPFYTLFADTLGMLRIKSWNELPQVMGMDIYSLHYYTDTVSGPNARHNVFGYVCFGYYGSIIFSIILGGIAGFVRSLFFSALQNYSMLIKLILAYFYLGIFVFETDFVLAFSKINSAIIVLPVIFVTASLLLFCKNKIIIKKAYKIKINEKT